MTTTNKGLDIYSIVRYYGFTDKIAKYVVSQAAHETSGFTSLIYNLNNNLFGMKYAGQSSAKGEKNGYAYYDNIEGSVYDFSRWWVRARANLYMFPMFINSLPNYVHALKNNNYFEDTEENYLAGCQYYYNQLYGNE